MIERLLKGLRARDTVSEHEAGLLAKIIGTERRIANQTTIIRAGEPLRVSTLLIEGFIARQKDLEDGKRQISALHVPGDFLDLHSFTLRRLDHDLVAMSDCRIATVSHENLKQVTEAEPHLTRLLWMLTNIDAAMHRQWAVCLGGMPAIGRIAHLFCELQTRLRLVGLDDGNTYALPLNQRELGECTGLTSIHVSRTLALLRNEGVAEFSQGRVMVYDRKALERIGDFEPGYLYLTAFAR